MRTRRSQSSSDSVPSSAIFLAGKHAPVLLHEVVEGLVIAPDDIVVDATLGGAGHARAIAEKLGRRGVFIGFDLDPEAISRAEKALEGTKPKVYLVHANFRRLAAELQNLGIGSITKALFDFGWSSDQLKAGRGFSFSADEPLLMTYAVPTPGILTAEQVVNEWSEQSLADVIFGWGEERYARRIAKAIVAHREKAPFKTARELAEVIRHSVPAAYRRGRIHPATRTFQALRIAVNDELGALTDGLRAAWDMLAPGGRIAVIAFHSIEDRIVKRAFAEWDKEGKGKRIFKKPVRPTAEELEKNPRSRSAKLRIIQKTVNSEH